MATDDRIMTPCLMCCMLDYSELYYPKISFTKGKTYCITLSEDRNYDLRITGDFGVSIHFDINSHMGSVDIPKHFITIKECRKLKILQIKNIIYER